MHTSVAVVTDSTQYLPRELADEQGIHQVSLYVGWQGRPERELEMDGFDAFYKRLASDPELPTTSQPSIGDFLAVWEPLLDQGRDIVSIHLAGGISGTCEAARQAHGLLGERGLGERVEVIDGETACGGMGLLVLAACAASRAGADRGAVVERVREARKALKIWFCLDTLEYLRRGGRIGKAQAWLGGTLRWSTRSSRWSECAPRGGRSSGWCSTPSSCMTKGPTDGWCSTFRRPSRPSG
jgi:DegV family protein with EDD domain